MNAERLAQLIEWSDKQACQYGNCVKRLAWEREALLKSLKALLADGGKYEPPAGTGPLEFRLSMTRDEYRAAQAAIAMAVES